MASSNHGESSSVASDPEWRYDVFLSFRGETRLGFTAHLHEKLLDQGISKVFLDEEELQIGKPISDLFSAIEQSRLAILVISPYYASSTWCLRELSKILECMEARGGVLPIFYSVEPSDVGKQLGTFKQAFAELEERFLDDNEKVVQWRAALRKVTEIKGWTSKDRSEPELIKEIVEEVRDKIRPVLLEPAEKLVGIDSRLDQLDSLLDTGSNNVCLIGICGLGGIGKTTLAERAYGRICTEFEASSFLERVRVDNLANLKRKLCMNLMNRDIRDWNMHEEERLRHFLLRTKVLLILDDVDHINQLRKLCGDPKWFHPGSRIIITTRDERLLIACGIERIYKMQGLNDDDALRLFSWEAFGRDFPHGDYMPLSKRFVNYANGLPLALKVLGSLLHGSDQESWHGELRKLNGSFNGEIMDILKISYEGLNQQQKSIFLDIACFFRGMYKDRVLQILANCFDLGIDIDILIKRSLISISDNMVCMHDLLQKMGQSIVRQQSQDPGGRSRLWLYKDIIHVLRNNTGTAAISGIVQELPESKWEVCHPEAFSNMLNLKLLKLHNVHPSKDLRCVPKSLRFFEWRGYSLTNLPPDFEPDELVELSVCHSSIKQLWNGIKNFDMLRVMNLSHSKDLTRTPDFIKIQNLERLDLEGCESLEELHPSIGVLKKLKFLNLKDCKSLVSLPDKFEIAILEILILSGCSKVRKIPEFDGCMDLVLELSLDGTAIESIPSSIEHLSSLSSLNLRDCINLKSLPSTIGSLKVLKSLDVSGCSKLAEFPQSLGKLELLEKIDVSRTAIREWSLSIVLPKNLKSLLFCGKKLSSQQPWYMSLYYRLFPMSLYYRLFPMKNSILPPLSGLSSLRELDLSNRNLWDGALPSDIGCLSSLLSLNLSGNNFISLPGSISQLPKLENLYLSRCSKLQQLPVLSSDKNLELTADGCSSLKEMQYPLNLAGLNCSCFNFINCFGMVIQSNDVITFTMLQRYLTVPGDRFEIVIPGSQIPWLFSHQRVGSSVSVDLTPDWNDSKWMGYALCAVFEVFGSGWELSCVLEVNGKEEYPAPLLSTDVQPVSDHLWLFYVSRDISFGTEWQNSCNQLVFSFRNSGPSMVKKCGVRLVYEQDVEEYKRLVTHSS
ncbi:putative toll-like receptor, P-loop containing nucleoside triphosphate hydrolase [Rosa chinensis]|uniref:ADP-ribosyl cyclase/cyclic ADP-ribose hydrolase n=1 Tax=Rosa chinensis TaxID=74649 RepID=A0A2P6PKL6_ROSCH|nr:TMV resistance protein N [Rosa chinensis]XP_024161959.1 TMV resistance protein N [Rosa chinensis]PRQ22478.1 putative toll-like receptor, P-loop containing nucleoside triphosphate hydrolase [Rosa chinensis]